jgi:hypothetical protein
MAAYPSIEALVSSVTLADLKPVMPRMAKVGDDTRFVIPGDEGYASS